MTQSEKIQLINRLYYDKVDCFIFKDEDVNEIRSVLETFGFDVYTSEDDVLKAYTHGGVFIVDMRSFTDKGLVTCVSCQVCKTLTKGNVKYTRNKNFFVVYVGTERYGNPLNHPREEHLHHCVEIKCDCVEIKCD